MPDVLIFGDTERCPELRHEVPLAVGDGFVYLERDGAKHVVVSSLELPRLVELGGFEVHPYEEFGIEELRRTGLPAAELFDALHVRAVQQLGVSHAVVPPAFPLGFADQLRAAGVELTV